MEFPNVGQHCAESTCNRLDFLPIKCDSCSSVFCGQHIQYDKHGCENPKRDHQVPVCPLCDQPVPVGRDELPDIKVGQHIDNDCRDERRKKIFTNKCRLRGCKRSELVPVVCRDCGLNFCLTHRHPTDHKCTGSVANRQGGNPAANAALRRQQEAADAELAKALARSEEEYYSRPTATTGRDRRGGNNNCVVT